MNKLPEKWWDKGINPILGYRYRQPSGKGVHFKYELLGTTRSHV